jgi:hypothetical protein
MAKASSTTELFLGEDHAFAFHIKNAGETASLDIAGWNLSWIIKRRISDSNGNAILRKTTGSGISITGTFDANPATNTQRATVSVADTDTEAKDPGLYYWELKRTDANQETILSYGRILFIGSAHTDALFLTGAAACSITCSGALT